MHGPCRKFCSNYDAEAIAISKALTMITNKMGEGTVPPVDVVVFTDSQSALDAIDSHEPDGGARSDSHTTMGARTR